MSDSINKDEIIKLLPHREPMLLIDKLINIKKLFSATAIVNVKKDSFYVQGHFPGHPVMPGVFIVEAFGQAAAALTAGAQDRDCLVLVELTLRRQLVVRDRVLLEPRDVGDMRLGKACRQHHPAAGQQRRLAAAGAAHVELVAARAS